MLNALLRMILLTPSNAGASSHQVSSLGSQSACEAGDPATEPGLLTHGVGVAASGCWSVHRHMVQLVLVNPFASWVYSSSELTPAECSGGFYL